MIWAAIIVAIVVAGPFIFEALKPPVDDACRDNAPGQFAELSGGKTHFQWHGPGDGKLLVCVHGLTTPSYVWDQLMPYLVGAGYRVLTYDLYGRGYSDRAPGKQDQDFFLRQLRELLAHEAVEGKFDLLGYSMGGIVVAGFAASEPARIHKLFLLAPAGMKHTPGRFPDVVRRIPVLGDWMMLAFGARFLSKGAERSAEGELGTVLGKRQAAEASRRGYLPAVLSSQRFVLSGTLNKQHASIQAAGLETVAIWGETDDVIPLYAKDVLSGWSPGSTHYVIKRAGHALGMTHPEDVFKAISSST